MSGKLTTRARLKGALLRRRITLAISLSLSLVVAAIGFAIFDFVRTARQKDQQVQAAALNSELAQFVLGVREDDGFSLLDNSLQLSRESRPLTVLIWNKPFFSYFLQQANAKSFSTKNLKWEPPRSCVVEFQAPNAGGTTSSKTFRLQACFAVLPNDPSGRYIYFSLRYPDKRVVRHAHGGSLLEADRVSLKIKGDRQIQLDLVFEAPGGVKSFV